MAAVILAVLTGCGGGSKTTAPISGTGGAGGGTAGTGGSGGGPGGSGGSGGSAGTGGKLDAGGGIADAAPPAPPADGQASDAAPSAPGAGSWRNAAAIPVPREEHGVAVVNDQMFIVGGTAASAARVDSFDPKTGAWTAHAPLPTGMDHLSVAGVGGKLYVLGGTQSGNSWVYDPGTRMWSTKAPMPVHRAATGVGVIGTVIYLAGGYDQPRGVNSSTDFQAYDTATDSWKSSSGGDLPALEVPRNHLQGAVVDGRFYIMGGRVAMGGGDVYNRLDMYDPATNKWQGRAAMPHKRAAGAAGVVKGVIVFAVGEGNPTGANRLFNIAEAYDPKTDSWTALAPLKVARHGLGAASIGDKLYVAGGSTAMAGGSPTDVVEELTL